MVEIRKYNLKDNKKDIYLLFDKLKQNYRKKIEKIEGMIHIKRSNGGFVNTQKAYILFYDNESVIEVVKREHHPITIFGREPKNLEKAVINIEGLLKRSLELDKTYIKK